jgi:hypothetical protein
MSKIARFVVWICSKFTRVEIEQIVNGLLDVLNNPLYRIIAQFIIFAI